MSNKSFQGNSSGPGSRTRRKMSGEDKQPALSKNKCKELIGDMLIANGQREMLKRLVQSRLAQSGWTYAMRTKYIEYIKQKGVENVNVSHMIAETVPKGVETFPEPVRQEIEDLLWGFSTEFISVDENSLPPTENDGSFSDILNYQSRDAKPEPGVGYNVPTPEIALSRTPSPSILPPRPLTPQLAIPILRPENIKGEIKEEPLCQDDEELSSNMDENEDEDDMEDIEDEVDIPLPNHTVESEEEELMDV